MLARDTRRCQPVNKLLPTKEQMLAADLAVEWTGISRAGNHVFGPVVYRFENEEARDTFGHEAMRVLLNRTGK